MKNGLLKSMAIALILMMPFPPSVPQAMAKGVDPEETVEYYLYDHLGGIDAILDEEGNVVERTDYLPYGEERISEGADGERHGFTGKELDSESGLYYYGARHYDPALGRFVSLDPLTLGESSKSFQSVLADPQALNGYSYVTNNPVRYVDETGMYGEDFHYTLTFYLMIKAGFDDKTASEIAFFDDRTDTDPATAPVSAENVVSGSTWSNHFIWESVARERVEGAIGTGNIREFASVLHTFQDSAGAHKGLDPLSHTINFLKEKILGLKTDPDKTVNDPEKAYYVASETYLYGRALKMNQLGLTDEKEINIFYQDTIKGLSDIRPDVEDYLSSEDKSGTAIKKEVDKRSSK